MKNNMPQDPGQQKNLYLALFLAGIVMLGWELFYNGPAREAREEARLFAEQAKAQQTLEQAAREGFNTSEVNLGDGGDFSISTTDLIPAAKTFINREDALENSTRDKFESSEIHGSINLTGLKIDDLTLIHYKQTQAEDSPEVVLLSPSGVENSNFAQFNWIAHQSNIKTPDSKSVWTKTAPNTYQWNNGAGVRFVTEIRLDDKYMFHVKQYVFNDTGESLTFSPFGLVSKTETIEEKAPLGIMHTGPLGVFDGELQEFDYDDLRDDGSKTFESITSWIGISDKYWLKALVPQAGEKSKVKFRYNNKGNEEKFQIDYLGAGQEVRSGNSISFETKMFAGAKELDVIEGYQDEYKIKLFDRSIDFGWFYFLTKPLTQFLSIIYEYVGNFGVAILILTLCVKTLLFPLARKGYKSMGKLRVLAPKMKELQATYKDDKVQLQQKMMELYRKEKVNPASGCVPILLQIPVFFALYKVLFVSLEMRHAPFYGWIKDLSAPDPTAFWNLFGLLPYDSPDFLAIGVWPILFAITMYMQQAISPQPADPTQAKVMKLLPLLFIFLFHSFPAGLIIYWTFSNLLTFSQQYYFTRNADDKK